MGLVRSSVPSTPDARHLVFAASERKSLTPPYADEPPSTDSYARASQGVPIGASRATVGVLGAQSLSPTNRTTVDKGFETLDKNHKRAIMDRGMLLYKMLGTLHFDERSSAQLQEAGSSTCSPFVRALEVSLAPLTKLVFDVGGL